MFCPHCATENGSGPAYCRQCGQSLADVRLAIEGSSAKSLEQLRAGAKWMKGGIATLTSFIVIGIIITIVGVAVGDPGMSTIAMINVLLGALIGLPLVLVGKSSVGRATRLLSQAQTESKPTLGAARQDLPEVRPRPELFPPGSATENTTLNLNRANRNTQD